MKQLKVQSRDFLTLEDSFREWLQLLNFDPSTIRNAPVKAREFFYWLERRDVITTRDITRDLVKQYFDYLGLRQHSRKGGRLSKNYLRTHLTALRKLARFLSESGKQSFETQVFLSGHKARPVTVLTREEISLLYKACGHDLLGARDRAMLGVYYGCGLRRSEGVWLDTQDVIFEQNLLYVSRGKNYTRRYVPLTGVVREDLQNYLNYARPVMARGSEKALFVSLRGTRLCSNAMMERLQQLTAKALITGRVSLHTLRHSVATHLLDGGMPLDKIQRFLGHSSMASTQIYTHLAGERE